MNTKRIQTALLAIAVLYLFPMAANAQGVNNINVNLNDVMVSQRIQDMSRMLNDANSSMNFSAKQNHRKHNKKVKDQRVAQLQSTDEQKTASNAAEPSVLVSGSGNVLDKEPSSAQ